MGKIKEFLRGRYNIVLPSLVILLSSLVYLADKGLRLDRYSFFYASLGLMLVTVIYYEQTAEDEALQNYLYRSNVFLWTLSTFVSSRLLVKTAGIGNPSSPKGQVMGIPIFQMWMSGYHLHHYFLGILLIAGTTMMLLEGTDVSKNILAAVYGIGLGLLLDESGFLLSMGNYTSPITFPVAGGVLLLLFVFTVNREIRVRSGVSGQNKGFL